MLWGIAKTWDEFDGDMEHPIVTHLLWRGWRPFRMMDGVK
jgi:hypothetical protein